MDEKEQIVKAVGLNSDPALGIFSCLEGILTTGGLLPNMDRILFLWFAW